MTRLSKNIVYNLAGQLSTLILGFVAVKFIFGRLGADVLGIIYLTAALNALLVVALDLGVSSTTTREVSAWFGRDPAYVRDVVRTGSFFYWSAFLVSAAGVYLAAPWIVHNWLNLTSLAPDVAVRMLRILGVASLFALPQSLYVSLFKGLQRMQYNNAVDAGYAVLKQAGTIAILSAGGDVFHVVYLFAACFVLPIPTYLLCASRFLPVRAFLPRLVPEVFRRNRIFAAKLTLQTVLLTLHQQLDRLVISKLMPVGLLGYYSFAYSNVRKANVLQNAIVTAAYPSFCELFGKQDRRELLARFRRLQDLVCFGMVPVLALIPFALLPVFTYVFNARIAAQLHLPVTLLCVGFYLMSTLRLSQVLATATGQPEINVLANFYSLLLMLPVTAVAICLLGLTGAGLAVIVRWLFHYVYAVPRYCKRCLDLSATAWYWHVARVLLLAAGTYGTMWFLVTLEGRFSVLMLSQAYLAATVLFLIGSYRLLSEELRRILASRVQLWLAKPVESAQ